MSNPATALRIVSIVPSLTHTLAEIGLRSSIVGITQFCVLPPDLHRTATIIGGTKNPDVEKVLALHPTHVLVNEEENKPEHIAALSSRLPTLNTFPKGPEDVPSMLRAMGNFLNARAAADAMAQRIESMLQKTATHPGEQRRFLYFIWRGPYMVASADTYISRMLGRLGWVNAASEHSRYPEMTLPEILAAKAEVLLLSSEPYPFRKRDVEALKREWGTTRKSPPMILCDGQLLSWYGALTEPGLGYLATLQKQ